MCTGSSPHQGISTLVLFIEEESMAQRQPTISAVIERKTPYPFDYPRARQLTRIIGELIAVDNEAFNIVNRIGFVHLMAILLNQGTSSV